MKNFLTMAFVLLISIGGSAQKVGKHVYIPGNGHLDVEQFIKPIDTRMDISRLSLAELRILRNAFAARQGFALKDAERQGFALKDADLRHIFMQTSWYDSLVWNQYDISDNPSIHQSFNDWTFFSGYTEYDQPVKLTPAERAFIRKIQDREQALKLGSCFGGGMRRGEVCGACTGATPDDRACAHENGAAETDRPAR